MENKDFICYEDKALINLSKIATFYKGGGGNGSIYFYEDYDSWNKEREVSCGWWFSTQEERDYVYDEIMKLKAHKIEGFKGDSND